MSAQPIPAGYHTLTPYLAVENAGKLVAFLKAAFDAEVQTCAEHEGVIFNAEVKVGTSMIMIADTRGRHPNNKTAIYMYVTDVDAVYAQAIKAGGKPITPPTDQFYGDRSGGVEDPAGNQWWIATHVKDVAADEVVRHMTQGA